MRCRECSPVQSCYERDGVECERYPSVAMVDEAVASTELVVAGADPDSGCISAPRTVTGELRDKIDRASRLATAAGIAQKVAEEARDRAEAEAKRCAAGWDAAHAASATMQAHIAELEVERDASHQAMKVAIKQRETLETDLERTVAELEHMRQRQADSRHSGHEARQREQLAALDRINESLRANIVELNRHNAARSQAIARLESERAELRTDVLVLHTALRKALDLYDEKALHTAPEQKTYREGRDLLALWVPETKTD